jgi:hypothetical protein
MPKLYAFLGAVAAALAILSYFGISYHARTHTPPVRPPYSAMPRTFGTPGAPPTSPQQQYTGQAAIATQSSCEQALNIYESNPSFYGRASVDRMKEAHCERWINIPPYP